MREQRKAERDTPPKSEITRAALCYADNEAQPVEVWYEKWKDDYEIVEHIEEEGYMNFVYLRCTQEAKADMPQELTLFSPEWGKKGEIVDHG